MRFDELNWFDIENYLKVDNRLMIVLGACEQHGYLSLMTDVKIPQALADAASEQTGVLVAPALNFGNSPYFLSYPGTISLKTSTMLDVVDDIVRSLYGQGFRKILILNGHGGNAVVQGRIYELVNDLLHIQLRFYSWWLSHSIEQIAIRYDLKPSHANWLEAFSFTQVGDLPTGEKIPPEAHGFPNSFEAKKIYGDGVFGGKYFVEDSIMSEIFQAALSDIIGLLKFA